MSEKICVLLSTYNGEKYLVEQIDSVLNQKGVDVSLLIRDDGSTDGTIGILHNYAQKDSRVSFYNGANLGPCQSFFDLVGKADEYDYYAFCDQDDVWDAEKLIKAIGIIKERGDSKTPVLYCSNLRVVDQDLNFMHNCITFPINSEQRYQSLVEFYAVGCTEVFNQCAAHYLKKHSVEGCIMHDSWLFMICSFFGLVYYDKNPYISYRQHGSNVIGTSSGKKGVLKERIKRLFDVKTQPRFENAKIFYSEFSKELNEVDSHKFLRIINYKQSIIQRINLLFDFSIRAYTLKRDIRYRLLILLGKI
jgi:rhamnosyltransferase